MKSTSIAPAKKAPNKSLKVLFFVLYLMLACIVVLNAEFSLIADTCNQGMSDSFKGIIFSVITWAFIIVLSYRGKSALSFWISLLIPSCYFIAVLPRSFVIFSHVAIRQNNVCSMEVMDMSDSRIDAFDMIGGISWLLLSQAAICFLCLALWRFLYRVKHILSKKAL